MQVRFLPGLLIFRFLNWFVYVLQSEIDLTFYVGMSQDVKKRLVQHNAGKSKYTSGHRPWKLIYFEETGTSTAARKREKYFKSAAGKKYLHKIIDAGSLLGSQVVKTT